TATVTSTPATIIINVSICYTSSLILKIIVTTTPTTTRATPSSKNVTVESSTSPKNGKITVAKVSVKNGSPKIIEPRPVSKTIKAPIAETILKSKGILYLIVSIS